MKSTPKLLFFAFFAYFILQTPYSFGSQVFTEKDTTIYPLVISFFSVASGIDLQAKREMDILINDFEKAFSVKLTTNEFHWGREGETDYCMELTGLSPKSIKKLVKKAKSIAKKSGRVTIREKSTCLHKR